MKMDENGGWKRMEKECIGMDKMGNKWENHGKKWKTMERMERDTINNGMGKGSAQRSTRSEKKNLNHTQATSNHLAHKLERSLNYCFMMFRASPRLVHPVPISCGISWPFNRGPVTSALGREAKKASQSQAFKKPMKSSRK